MVKRVVRWRDACSRAGRDRAAKVRKYKSDCSLFMKCCGEVQMLGNISDRPELRGINFCHSVHNLPYENMTFKMQRIVMLSVALCGFETWSAR